MCISSCKARRLAEGREALRSQIYVVQAYTQPWMSVTSNYGGAIMTYSEIKAELESDILKKIALVEKAKIVLAGSGRTDLASALVVVQANIDAMRKRVVAIDRIIAKYALA